MSTAPPQLSSPASDRLITPVVLHCQTTSKKSNTAALSSLALRVVSQEQLPEIRSPAFDYSTQLRACIDSATNMAREIVDREQAEFAKRDAECKKEMQDEEEKCRKRMTMQRTRTNGEDDSTESDDNDTASTVSSSRTIVMPAPMDTVTIFAKPSPFFPVYCLAHVDPNGKKPPLGCNDDDSQWSIPPKSLPSADEITKPLKNTNSNAQGDNNNNSSTTEAARVYVLQDPALINIHLRQQLDTTVVTEEMDDDPFAGHPAFRGMSRGGRPGMRGGGRGGGYDDFLRMTRGGRGGGDLRGGPRGARGRGGNVNTLFGETDSDTMSDYSGEDIQQFVRAGRGRGMPRGGPRGRGGDRGRGGRGRGGMLFAESDSDDDMPVVSRGGGRGRIMMRRLS